MSRRIFALLFLCMVNLMLGTGSPALASAQAALSGPRDTTQEKPTTSDIFGPVDAENYAGRGSGGVITPSPYDNLLQTYYTRISADYEGVRNMLDSPWQLSLGTSWTPYESEILGILAKLRSYGLRDSMYNPVVEAFVPYYRWPFEASVDYSLNERTLRAYKFRIHSQTEPKGLGMAGLGVLVSTLNLMVARDIPMNRKVEAEITWKQLSGGYIMPLPPFKGGVNVALSFATDIAGLKYQAVNSDDTQFYGFKVGSLGFLLGLGWNALESFNLSVYGGAEWGFSAGVLEVPSGKYVGADNERSSLCFGVQGSSSWFNLVGGIQREWDHLSTQESLISQKGLRYYLGANIYIQR